MKMAGYWRLTVLFTVLGVLLGARAQSQHVKMVGSEVTLEPQYRGDPSEINWKINGNRLVDMEVIPQDEPPVFYYLQDRASIDRTNGRLTIRDLRIEDSGVYRAEVLVNNVFYNTEITLTVRAQSQHVKMVGSEVTLEPQYRGDPSEINWKINGNRLVDMEVIPQDEPPVFYYLQDRASIDRTNGRLTIRDLRIEDSGVYRAEVLVNNVFYNTEITLTVRAQSQHVKMVGSEVTLEPQYTGNPSEINWKINDNKLVDMELTPQDEPPVFYYLQDRASIDGTNGRLTIRNLTIEDSGVYRAEVLVNNAFYNTEITLTVRERYPCITVKFQTKDQPKGKVKPRLTIHDVKPEDHDRYLLEVLQSDGQKYEFSIKETDGIVIIRIKDDRVTLTVPDTEKVTKLTWKKGGVALFQWAVSGLKLHTNNITLKPGFVTVNNAEGEGSYKVEVRSTDSRITNNTLHLEGLPEPIGSLTFHPSIMTDKITLKKDGEPVNIDNDRIKSSPYGDLTINNVTSGDGGKYTVQCDDQKQEFILGL